MVRVYSTDELEALQDQGLRDLAAQGYRVERDAEIRREIRWRPHLLAARGGTRVAVQILFDGLLPRWLDLDEVAALAPDLIYWWVVPADVPIPHETYQNAAHRGHWIFVLDESGLATYLDPAAIVEVQMIHAFPVLEDTIAELSVYKTEVLEARKAYNAGLPREAVGIIGRALETACFDTIRAARQSGALRIPNARLSKMSFDEAVHFLREPAHNRRKYQKILSPRQHDNIMSVKWDRNIADHPATDEEVQEVKEMAPGKIHIGVQCLKLLLRKQFEFKSKATIRYRPTAAATSSSETAATSPPVTPVT